MSAVYQGNRILIFESTLIYQHFYPEPVEGLHPLPLMLSLLPLILSLSKDDLSTTSLDNSTSPSQSPFIKAFFLDMGHPLICLS